MAYSQEQSLAAGLLTALIPGVPTPTSQYVLASATPSPTSQPGHGDNGEGGAMHEWSSLIGIVTALAGNVLISLALNIQRYAHIRIDRELERDKAQQEQDWKRTNSDQGTTGPYGAVSHHNGDDAGRGGNQPRHSGRYEPYTDQPHIDTDDHDGRDDHSDVDDRMRNSFLSDRTVRPGEKDLRRKSYLRSPYWWVGIVLMCLGETGNFMAYGFAPASIVSPLGVVALISNCVIAPFMLKEQFRTRDFWGVLIAIAGAVVVVLSAKSSEEKIGPHEIWVMITRWEFELYLGLTAALIVALMWASGKYGQRTILIDVGLVALFGGYTALSTKGVSSLLSFTLWHVITFPVTYLLVFVLVFSALMQIRYINRALQRFDSTQVIPTQFVLFTLSVIIGSAVLYRDFQSYTVEMASKFVGGCLLTFLGVYFITSGRVRNDDESSFSADDEEESIGLIRGGQYRDRIDMSPPAHPAKVQRPGQTAAEAHDELQSPNGSLLSRGLEEVDDSERTPRGVLSAAPSSPRGSFSYESLSEPSPGPSSPPRAHSLLKNPWADMPESSVATPNSEPQIRRPSTPDRSHNPSASTVLLRFPAAPGAEDVQSATPARKNSLQGAARNNTVPQTPPSRRLRGSISSRFSPGPLLPTISAGFSAVVAESLRRGETSPLKERRHRKRISQGGPPGTTVVDGFLRNRESPATRNPGYETDGSAEGGHDPRFALPTARLHSTGDIATAPVTAGSSTPAVDTQGVVDAPVDELSSSSRIRSLSDSWSGGVAWLGAALGKPSNEEAADSHTTVVESSGDGGHHRTQA